MDKNEDVVGEEGAEHSWCLMWVGSVSGMRCHFGQVVRRQVGDTAEFLFWLPWCVPQVERVAVAAVSSSLLSWLWPVS